MPLKTVFHLLRTSSSQPLQSTPSFLWLNLGARSDYEHRVLSPRWGAGSLWRVDSLKAAIASPAEGLRGCNSA
jgi:hypothetical protein